MQNNAKTPRGRESAGDPRAAHLRTRANLAKPESKTSRADREGFSDKLARDCAFVAEPTD